nr:MAG TPA: hypothetical protein [Caudoviricetes sp.]
MGYTFVFCNLRFSKSYIIYLIEGRDSYRLSLPYQIYDL